MIRSWRFRAKKRMNPTNCSKVLKQPRCSTLAPTATRRRRAIVSSNRVRQAPRIRLDDLVQKAAGRMHPFQTYIAAESHVQRKRQESGPQALDTGSGAGLNGARRLLHIAFNVMSETTVWREIANKRIAATHRHQVIVASDARRDRTPHRATGSRARTSSRATTVDRGQASSAHQASFERDRAGQRHPRRRVILNRTRWPPLSTPSSPVAVCRRKFTRRDRTVSTRSSTTPSTTSRTLSGMLEPVMKEENDASDQCWRSSNLEAMAQNDSIRPRSAETPAPTPRSASSATVSSSTGKARLAQTFQGRRQGGHQRSGLRSEHRIVQRHPRRRHRRGDTNRSRGETQIATLCCRNV